MSEEQIRILNKIADDAEKSARSVEDAKKALQGAGIITVKGNVKKPYKDIFTRQSDR